MSLELRLEVVELYILSKLQSTVVCNLNTYLYSLDIVSAARSYYNFKITLSFDSINM